MTNQPNEFLKWAAEMERSANAFAGSGADLGIEAGNRKIAELLRRAAAIEGERDELLGGKILNQLVAHRLKTKLAALVEKFEAYLNSEDEDRVAEWTDLCEAFKAAKETPQ